ncbi:MAG TPA: helix-hairpin-helix domain-containing protein [Anaerolineaceae bacterium]|nr:helix-hairpin-helix domain-containing protein [Anaerolineaceae bacterium]
MERRLPANEEIADQLDRIADLLEIKEANPFRIRAYRDGANTIRQAKQPVAELVEQGKEDAVQALPGIGGGLFAVIAEFVTTGDSGVLRRLEAEVDPRQAFARVPGIGPELADRLVDGLKIHTLEELEQAAYDGRLEGVEGFGSKRISAVKDSLAGILSLAARRRRARGGEPADETRPSVALLLSVDAEYRQKAAKDELRKIAPNRFNPDQVAWLPVFDTERSHWKFTALFSNTARAHELGMTHDWVVIYYERDGVEDQSTVVTATSGELTGQRVVRGRETETRQYYRTQKQK